MLTYAGGQNVGKGAYWDLRNGRRIDVDEEVVLPGGAASTYFRIPAGVMLLFGPIIGMLFVVLFPFIAFAVVLMFAVRRIVESLISFAVKSVSFHWNPMDAYLTGKKNAKWKKKSDKN